MSHLLTQQTILAFQQGDETAFRLVFNAYYEPLLYFTHKLTNSRQEAEDITLRVFAKLFNRYALFESEQNIRAFLYIAARNECLNYLKTLKSIGEGNRQWAMRLQDDTLLEYEYAIKLELLRAIYNEVEKLPLECRKIFRMLYLEDLSPGEVADRLKIAVSTVYVQKSRAINILRLKFQQFPLIITWLFKVLWYC